MDEEAKLHGGRGDHLRPRLTPTRQLAPDAQLRPGTVAPIIRTRFDTTLNTASPSCARSHSTQHAVHHIYQSSRSVPPPFGDASSKIRPISPSSTSFSALPVEVRQQVFDYISGEMHSVTSTQPSHRLSSSMRHPRRKAISDLALVSSSFRESVQERIYRHIKIKGTRHDLKEVQQHFQQNQHLTRYVRHIEVWVPIWSDRTTYDPLAQPGPDAWAPPLGGGSALGRRSGSGLSAAEHDSGMCYMRSLDSATLEEIFSTVWLFHGACIFTLEAGHAINSNMVKPFRLLRFEDAPLPLLPQIRTFAMRGAWNIMRSYEHWSLLQNALPNVQEWHCNYVKPRPEAYETINQVLKRYPKQLRHLNISLDGMYNRDSTPPSSFSAHSPHLCEQLGQIAPSLESLSYTGKICSCFWDAAGHARKHLGPGLPRLQSLEIVVKSCCRQRVCTVCPGTGEENLQGLSGIRTDGASITNLVFIRAFERLVLRTIESLDQFPLLENIRIRFIDLDSPCPQLNPYWTLQKNKCSGVWSEDILEALGRSGRGRLQRLGYLELYEGIDRQAPPHKGSRNGLVPVSGGGLCAMYPRVKPKSIKISTYGMVAEARGT